MASLPILGRAIPGQISVGTLLTPNVFTCDCCTGGGCVCLCDAGLCASNIAALFLSVDYYIDIAGFVDGDGVDCEAGNGTFHVCHCAGTGLVWTNSGTPLLTLTVSEDGSWSLVVSFPCETSETQEYLYTGEYSGCGSATLNLSTSTAGCPCDERPETIVLRTAEDDEANCNCPCFLDCTTDPFPTSLYVRLDNFSAAAVTGTVIDIEILFPPAASIFVFGCVTWNATLFNVPNGAETRLFTVFVQVACNYDGTVNVKVILIQTAGPLGPPAYNFESVYDPFACTYCDTTGTATSVSTADTVDFEIKCEPF